MIGSVESIAKLLATIGLVSVVIAVRPHHQATQRYTAKCFPYPVRIEPSLLGNHAALCGAAAIGLENLHTALFAKSSPGAVVALPAPKSSLSKRAAS